MEGDADVGAAVVDGAVDDDGDVEPVAGDAVADTDFVAVDEVRCLSTTAFQSLTSAFA